MRDLLPIHPGEILLEEFMKPMGIYQRQLARRIDLPTTHNQAQKTSVPIPPEDWPNTS